MSLQNKFIILSVEFHHNYYVFAFLSPRQGGGTITMLSHELLSVFLNVIPGEVEICNTDLIHDRSSERLRKQML